MTVRFADTTNRQCRNPVSGATGPDCRPAIYYRPNKAELKFMDTVLARSPVKYSRG